MVPLPAHRGERNEGREEMGRRGGPQRRDGAGPPECMLLLLLLMLRIPPTSWRNWVCLRLRTVLVELGKGLPQVLQIGVAAFKVLFACAGGSCATQFGESAHQRPPQALHGQAGVFLLRCDLKSPNGTSDGRRYSRPHLSERNGAVFLQHSDLPCVIPDCHWRVLIATSGLTPNRYHQEAEERSESVGRHKRLR